MELENERLREQFFKDFKNRNLSPDKLRGIHIAVKKFKHETAEIKNSAFLMFALFAKGIPQDRIEEVWGTQFVKFWRNEYDHKGD